MLGVSLEWRKEWNRVNVGGISVCFLWSLTELNSTVCRLTVWINEWFCLETHMHPSDRSFSSLKCWCSFRVCVTKSQMSNSEIHFWAIVSWLGFSLASQYFHLPLNTYYGIRIDYYGLLWFLLCHWVLNVLRCVVSYVSVCFLLLLFSSN